MQSDVKTPTFMQAAKYLDKIGVLENILPKTDEKTLPEIREDLISLAAIVKDTKKPSTLMEKNEKINHLQHHEEATKIICNICEKLNLARLDQRVVLTSLGKHMKSHVLLDMKDTFLIKMSVDQDWSFLYMIVETNPKDRRKKYTKEGWYNFIDEMYDMYKLDNSLKKCKKLLKEAMEK